MPQEPITNDAEHQNALVRLGELVILDPAPESAEGIELEALATRVEAYEDIHFPITNLTGAA